MATPSNAYAGGEWRNPFQPTHRALVPVYTETADDYLGFSPRAVIDRPEGTYLMESATFIAPSGSDLRFYEDEDGFTYLLSPDVLEDLRK